MGLLGAALGLRDDAQQAFAAGTNEYPVVEGVAPKGPVAGFGDFRADDLDMTALGEHQAEAVKIFDKAGWL
jgi:iron(III) transport system substrate-binding protein